MFIKLKTKKMWCYKCKKMRPHKKTDLGYVCTKCGRKWKDDTKPARALRIMMSLLIGTLLAGGLIFFGNQVLYQYGYSTSLLSCETHSMWPTLLCNDILIYKLYNQEPYVYRFTPNTFLPNATYLEDNIKNSTIVWVNYYGVNYVHRVIGKCTAVTYGPSSPYYYDGVITMGDNNTSPDGCIPYFAIKGELIEAIRVG